MVSGRRLFALGLGHLEQAQFTARHRPIFVYPHFAWRAGVLAHRAYILETSDGMASGTRHFDREHLGGGGKHQLRYQPLSTTISLDYFGDSIVNSVADIVCCGLGFAIAYKLRFWWSLALFAVTEAVLLFAIRDSLILNIIMLIYPIEAIRNWQSMI